MDYKNFVRGEVAEAVTATATTIKCSDPAAPFVIPPVPSSGENRLVLVDNEWMPTKFEVIGYAGITDNGDGTHTLTSVSRALEGSIAQTWDIGAIASLSMTGGILDEIKTAAGGLTAARVIDGEMDGWSAEPQNNDGTTPPTDPAQPDQWLYSKGAERAKLKLIWNSDGNVTQAIVEYSSDSGVTYSPLGGTGYPNAIMTIGYDADGNVSSISWS